MNIIRYLVFIGLMLHTIKGEAMNRFMRDDSSGTAVQVLSPGAQALQDRAARAEQLSQYYRKLASTNGKLENLKQQEPNATQLASSLAGQPHTTSVTTSTTGVSIFSGRAVQAPAPLRKIMIATCYVVLAALLWKFSDKAWDLASGDCQTEPRATAMCHGLSSTATTAAALVTGAALAGAVSSLAVGARVGKSAVVGSVNSLGTTVADGVAWVVASDEEDVI